MASNRLMATTKKELDLRLRSLEFAKREGTYLDYSPKFKKFMERPLEGIYQQSIGKEALLYFMCHPRTRSKHIVLEPLIAVENYALRRLIGEDEPKQLVPRFFHMFLSYTISSGMTFWSFKDEEGMKRALDEIEKVLRNAGIPFAEHWAQFSAAIKLLRLDRVGKSPWGVIVHHTRKSDAVLKKGNLLSKRRVGAAHANG